VQLVEIGRKNLVPHAGQYASEPSMEPQFLPSAARYVIEKAEISFFSLCKRVRSRTLRHVIE
jgi:hypothetical protein